MNIAEKLNLKRPLAVFDIESTGVNPRLDRIIELSVVKVLPDGSREVKTWLVNPEIPIPHESTEIHGITDRDVASCPPFLFIVDEVDAFRLPVVTDGLEPGDKRLRDVHGQGLPAEEIIAGAVFVLKRVECGERLVYVILILCIFDKGAAASQIDLNHILLT